MVPVLEGIAVRCQACVEVTRATDWVDILEAISKAKEETMFLGVSRNVLVSTITNANLTLEKILNEEGLVPSMLLSGFDSYMLLTGAKFGYSSYSKLPQELFGGMPLLKHLPTDVADYPPAVHPGGAILQSEEELHSGITYPLRFFDETSRTASFRGKIDAYDSELRRLANNIQPSHGQETLEWPEGAEELFLNKNAPIDAIDLFVSSLTAGVTDQDNKVNLEQSWKNYKQDKSLSNAEEFKSQVLSALSSSTMNLLIEITTDPSVLTVPVLAGTALNGTSSGLKEELSELEKKGERLAMMLSKWSKLVSLNQTMASLLDDTHYALTLSLSV